MIKKGKKHGIVAGWHQEFGDQLAKFLKRDIASAADVHDLSQEVFLRLLRVEKPELIQSPRAYLYRVAMHVLYEWRAREKREKMTIADDISELIDTDSLIINEENRVHITADVRKALKTIPPHQAAALLLHWQHGMTYSEVAEHLQVSERMVKRYIVKGYGALRIWFENDGKAFHG